MTATHIYTNETKSALIASKKIAVVNLDAGVKKGDKTIYYANKIIQYPGSNYQTTSLEEAKSGVENGRYAAYVLIPSDFSESVNSINTTPKQAVFEYLINSYLDADTREQMIYEILNFEQSINSSISYIYIDAILKEVHNLQDNSSTIMENDEDDLNAINDISAESLIEPVSFSEMKEKDAPIAAIDLKTEEKNMKSAVSAINKNYQSALSNGKDAYKKLVLNQGTVKESLNQLKTQVDGFNPFIDVKGNSYVITGLESLKSEVQTSNTEILNKRTQLNDSIAEEVNLYANSSQVKIDTQRKEVQNSIDTTVVSDLQGTVDGYLTDSNQKIGTYVQEQNTLISSQIAQYADSLQEYLEQSMNSDGTKLIIKNIASVHAEAAFQLASQKQTEYLQNQASIELSTKYNEAIDELNYKIADMQTALQDLDKAIGLLNGTYIEPAESAEPSETEIPIQTEVPDSSAESGSTVLSSQPVVTDSEAALLAVSTEPTKTPESTDLEKSVSTQQPDEPIKTELPDVTEQPIPSPENMIEEVTAKYTNLKEILSSFGQFKKQTIPDEMEKPDIHVEIDQNSIDTSPLLPFVNIGQATDMSGNSITQPSVKLEIAALDFKLNKDSITYKVPSLSLALVSDVSVEKLSKIEGYYMLPTDRFHKVVQEKLVNQIEARNTVLQGEVNEKMTSFTTEQSAYQSSLDAFDPFSYVDKESLKTDIESLSSNMTSVVTEVNNTSTGYRDYVTDVISTANENISKLQEDITSSNDKTGKNVLGAINTMKARRQGNSDTNISLLKGFTGKLSFTRIGDLPYREAYQFIINPITYQNKES